KQVVPFGSESALRSFAALLGSKMALPISSHLPVDKRTSFIPEQRQRSQVREIEQHVQALVRNSDAERYQFYLYKVLPAFGNRKWSTKSYHPYFSPDTFVLESAKYRQYFAEEIIGRFSDELLPPNARTRKVYDEKLWTGYEVVLDVYKDVIAPGILLLPKDLKPGERRPVVVCQHGRNGVPQILIEGNTSYYDMAAKLADRGFIVYAPYGIFSGEDRYRWLSRKANTVKKSMFSFVVSQHDQLLRWLGTLPYVDKNRIAFYGKSYGGETAMRVPSILEGYALSICSADFGDWTRKVADTHFSNSFMYTIEWEMPYFRMGSTFSYAEMAYLIFPRPFMVERGRHDLVQPDEFVAYEYAKVSYLYDQFNLLDKTQIEFFNGGHASRNDGTFDFLHKHLDWP
ncbi:MAG TPA: prolyl oligopeptidase family serine peptidase, partial [Chryseosolibacter sp.]|nr:prolyl oligopeptidase family serine peptidase [Chryseosolibacter sp.]